MRVRKRRGIFFPSRRREPERFSRGKNSRGAASLPFRCRVRASGEGGGLGFARPGSLAWERMQTRAQPSSSVPRFPFFCPLMHLPILLTAVTGPPEGSCPPGSLASAFVSRPGGCWYRPPPQVKGERWWGRGRGEDVFNAVGPVTCENEEKNVVSLWPSRGTRSNPAAASKAEFLAQPCGRWWGQGPVGQPRCTGARLLRTCPPALSPRAAPKLNAFSLLKESRDP